jgi:MoxR-like ATPase
MNVQQTLRTLLGLPPRISILLESNHGLGKSSVVAQAAAEMSKRLGKPFGFIDFRLAQCEVGDLIGMQRLVPQGEVSSSVFQDGVRKEERRKVMNVTIHDLAEWFPTDPDSCGFLFLDELPRAPRDVQNAVLELALDYRFHFRELPIGWRVISASNDNMDVYSGTQLDPALYDRFLKIKFKPTFPEWVEYAEKEGVHRAILTYLAKFNADLGLDVVPESGKITPTPRSWVKLSTIMKYMADNNDDPFRDHNYLHLLAKGFIGDIATNFIDYVKKNYKVYNAEDILGKYTDEMDAEFKAMLVTEIAFYSKEIVDHVKKSGKSLTKKQSENLLRFYQAIPKEAAADFWALFSGEAAAPASAWYRYEVVKDGKKSYPVTDYTIGFLSKSKAVK